jgi:hypothetical protein
MVYRTQLNGGGNFTFPEGIGDVDARDLKRAGSIAALCRERHQLRASKCLSVERVNRVVNEERLKWFDGQLDKLRALDIAEFGMVIPVSNTFKTSASRPPLRKKYLLVQHAVNKIIYEMYKKGGTVLLIPTEVAITIPGIHFSSQHWTTKKEKACGRSLGDASNDPHGNALNDSLGVVQDMVRKLWGPVVHPTLEDLVAMIVKTASKYGWDNISLWKMDLKGAFSLLRIHAEDVCKMAFELTDGITLLHTAGMFGWTGTPFAFSVFSRLLEGCIGCDIQGGLKVYVDDLCGCSGVPHLENDQEIAKSICLDLMGEGSLAEDKHEQGFRLDMLGWSFDLKLKTVTVSETNHLKTIYGFFSLNENRKYGIKVWQALASRASRYVTVCPYMKPYTASLYNMITKYHGNIWIQEWMSDECIEDVRMWKAFLCILMPFEKKFSRSLLSFGTREPTIKVEYDASLTGMGVVISKKCEESWKIICHIGMNFPFEEQIKMDSSYQNSCEFIAVVTALWLLAIMGYREFSYCLYGDSVSSLSWCTRGDTPSARARSAAILFSLINIRIQAKLESTYHVKGKDNVITDRLSRGTPYNELGLLDETTTSLETVAVVHRLLLIINPFVSYSLQGKYDQVRRQGLELLAEVLT